MSAARLAGWRRALIAAGVAVLVDQVTKAIVVAHTMLGDSNNVFLGLDLTYTRNRGVAFGALGGGGSIKIVFIIAALSALLLYFWLRSDKPWLWLPVGVVAGGALGNLADRARAGAVVDFIDPIAWPAFNVADMCITIGILGLVWVIEGPRQKEDDSAEAPAPGDSPPDSPKSDPPEGPGPGSSTEATA
jgi:signal peptidase II